MKSHNGMMQAPSFIKKGADVLDAAIAANQPGAPKPRLGDITSRALKTKVYRKFVSEGIIDQVATDFTNGHYQIADEMGAYKKRLFAKDSLKTMRDIFKEAKAYYYDRTLAWGDDGWRLLASVDFMPFRDKFDALTSAMRAEIPNVEAQWPTILMAAQEKLQGRFDPANYPDVSQLAKAFDLRVSFSNIERGSDFRVDLSESAADAVRAEMNGRNDQLTQDAVRQVWERVADRTGKMVERLRAFSPKETDAKGKTISRQQNGFHASLVEHVRGLADVLPSFNSILNDPHLEQITSKLRDDLCVFDVDDLKADPIARREVADRAEELYKTAAAFLA